MKILTVLNNDAAPPGLVGERIAARGGTWVEVNPHNGEALPRGAAEFDGLVVLGGAMSAADEAYEPAFGRVTGLVRAFHAAQKPVLGICLGVQLIARAFQNRVFPNHEVEFGFPPVRVTDAGADDPLLSGLGREHRLFQWHEDTFDVPDEAVLLMTGEGCRNQAFRVGAGTYGFQCHFEVTEELIHRWVRGSRAALARQLGPRAARLDAELEAGIARHMADAKRFARTLGDRWLDLVALRRGARG